MDREYIIQTCQNYDFEEYCKHDQPEPCTKWHPDLEYKRQMEIEKKECTNRECPYWVDGVECPAAIGCAGFM